MAQTKAPVISSISFPPKKLLLQGRQVIKAAGLRDSAKQKRTNSIISSLIFRSYLSQNGCGSRNYTSVGKSIAAENARETDGLVHTTTSMPTIRNGFDKQHAQVRLGSFELGSKVLK